jgi:hypothetical protein
VADVDNGLLDALAAATTSLAADLARFDRPVRPS